eukprot:1763354-Alexandrium_andersonii.AAC.1
MAKVGPGRHCPAGSGRGLSLPARAELPRPGPGICQRLEAHNRRAQPYGGHTTRGAPTCKNCWRRSELEPRGPRSGLRFPPRKASSG